jgi:hypothetical protein
MGYMNRRCMDYERIMTDMMYHAEPFLSVRIMPVVGTQSGGRWKGALAEFLEIHVRM